VAGRQHLRPDLCPLVGRHSYEIGGKLWAEEHPERAGIVTATGRNGSDHDADADLADQASRYARGHQRPPTGAGATGEREQLLNPR
jgi:hypothetical protein